MELYIGNTLKKLRLDKGLTQEDVATQLGISKNSRRCARYLANKNACPVLNRTRQANSFCRKNL